MDTRLKERLTGAAILVALVVMLVPEMFHGQRGDVAANTGSSGEGPPLRSYTIDLSNSPTRTAPLQSTPANPGGAGNDDKPATPPPPQSTAPASVPPTDAATGARSVAAAAPTPAPAAATAVPRADPPAVSANPRQAATAARHPSGGGWAVQLGLFARRDNAERLAHSAQAKGFAVSVSNADAKGLYRVYAGGMADRSAAEAFSQRLKDQGLPAAVIAAP